MNFLKKLVIQNFRCIRQEVVIDLNQATYLAGANNSGKTAFLAAIKCFFDTESFKSGDLNKTEFSAKKAGFNTSEISIEFDLNLVEGKVRKKRLIDKFGDRLLVKKLITYREASNTVNVEYKIQGAIFEFFDKLDKDVQDVLGAVSISYIHPQEGSDLLAKAQDKFKKRLFHNWGRHASVSDQLKELQKQWSELRRTANTYLSATLTESLKNFWPGSSTVIDLPENIEEIVAISDISFRSSILLPEVTLTSQGTGAQSIVLYQTHYLLDSDRSLHRGFYVPIWLLEEPESFLHADITVKLGNLLASQQWLGSIQMIVSTHSPIILACSRQSPDLATWAILEDHKVNRQVNVNAVTETDIELISRLMGDSNFDAYFTASQKDPLLFIEDKRHLTREKFEEAGLQVTKAFDGTSEAKKYLDVFRTVEGFAAKKAVVMLDNDKGLKEFGSLITANSKIREKNGFMLHGVGSHAYMLLLPVGLAVENLFDEFESTVEECVTKIFDDKYDLRDQVPINLSRVAGIARRSVKDVRTMDDAKALIQNDQDVKDVFWLKVKSSKLQMSSEKISVIQELIDIAK